ncbi:MAG TPA: cytochrome b/b6 domain-containing protein, partial [Microbacterium sp.]|nr:cytochrome b/b6 domain-containing protein [Microbacterium sp.]
MATYAGSVRRGLPRVPGGQPWPPAGDAPVQGAEAVASTPANPQELTPEHGVSAPSAPSAESRPIRRGLPRVPGGEPWPAAASAGPAVQMAEAAAPVPAQTQDVTLEQSADAREDVPVTQQAGTDAATKRVVTAEASETPIRRGLPRVVGGEPWPPEGFAPTIVVAAAETTTDAAALPVAATEGAPAPVVAASVTTELVTTPAERDLAPIPFTRTVWSGAAAREFERERRAGGAVIAPPEPTRIGPFTRLQWAGIVIVGGGGLMFAAAMAVLAVRWLLSLEPLQDFLTTYPGEYHLPEGAPVGIPPWLGWQHFFNVFLIVLIIRTGLQVRTEKRPTVFWTPRGAKDGKGKVSLNIWFHQSLDLLWVINGVIFVVLLFVTGQWMKIVPTSWEVFPNALSAGLQYVSLDWPTENGWVNYNSLQQLTYFATV